MIISVLSSIAIWSTVFVIALRIITNSGIALPNNKVISALTCNKKSWLCSPNNAQRNYICIFIGFCFQNCSIFVFDMCDVYVQ